MAASDTVVEGFFEHLYAAVEKGIERATALADLAKALGALYFLYLVGMFLVYRTLKVTLPLLIAAAERNQKNKRYHIRKLEQIRQATAARAAKRAPRKGKANDSI